MFWHYLAIETLRLSFTANGERQTLDDRKIYYIYDLLKIPKTTYKDTLFNYRNLAVDIKWFCAQIAWRLTCTVWRLHLTIERLDKVTALTANVERQLERQAMNALNYFLDSHNKSYCSNISRFTILILLQDCRLRQAANLKKFFCNKIKIVNREIFEQYDLLWESKMLH